MGSITQQQQQPIRKTMSPDAPIIYGSTRHCCCGICLCRPSTRSFAWNGCVWVLVVCVAVVTLRGGGGYRVAITSDRFCTFERSILVPIGLKAALDPVDRCVPWYFLAFTRGCAPTIRHPSPSTLVFPS